MDQAKPSKVVSMAYTVHQSHATLHAQDPVFRDDVNRGIYTKAGMPAPLRLCHRGVERADAGGGLQWELYNLTEDYSQKQRSRGEMPDQSEGAAEGVPQRGAKYERVFPWITIPSPGQ